MSPVESNPDNIRVIAIPVAGGRLCMHFGHSEQFALFDVDIAAKEVLNSRQLSPPGHQPGVLPRWLHEQGATLIVAGGMGRRAQGLFAENGIEVIVGVPGEPPETVVQTYLNGNLQPGKNICDH